MVVKVSSRAIFEDQTEMGSGLEGLFQFDNKGVVDVR